MPSSYRHTTHKGRTHTMLDIWEGAEIISSYSRKQAVEEGVLIDPSWLSVDTVFPATPNERFDPKLAEKVRQVTRQHHPAIAAREGGVCLTAGLWALVRQAVAHPQWRNDWAGVLHDIYGMSRPAVVRAMTECNETGTPGVALFRVIITGTGRVRNHVLKVVASAEPWEAVDGELMPCLTYMLREED